MDKKTSIDRRNFIAAAGATLAAASFPFSANASGTEGFSGHDLSFLKNLPTSLIESAIYLLKGTHDGITITLPGLKRQTAGGGTVAGFAVTATFSTDPIDERGKLDNLDYWEYVFAADGPKIAVAQDVSKIPGSGSSWGRQNANIHKGLGCLGVITNGGVRDIDEFDRVRLAVFSGSLTVGHGAPHFITCGKPVELYGAKINSGDIVCADEHGAIIIPSEMLPHIAEAAQEALRRTKVAADYCSRKDFTPKGLAQALESAKPAKPWKPSSK